MKKIIALLAFVFITLHLGAQLRSGYATTRFYKNWIVGLNGGQTLYFAEGNTFSEESVFSFKENGGYALRAELGYEFTQVVTLRGMVAINRYNWPDLKSANANESYTVIPFQSENLTLDLMINLRRLFNKSDYRQNFKFYAFAGMGVAYRDKLKFTSDFISPILRGGLQASIRLSDNLDATLIADGNFVNDKFNDYTVTFPYDMYSTLSLGICYHIRQTGRNY